MTLQTDGTDRNGNYDMLVKHLGSKKLRRIIDIGAWWGPWSLYWQTRSEKIEIFEPNKTILPMLEHNLSKFDNCTIHRTALGDKKGKVSMAYDSHSGTNHITSLDGDITLNTLDSYNFNAVDVIKIDVEGYEIAVLQGAKRTILQQKPMLQIEANKSGKRYGKNKLHIMQLLNGWGMTRLEKKWPDQVWAFK